MLSKNTNVIFFLILLYFSFALIFPLISILPTLLICSFVKLKRHQRMFFYFLLVYAFSTFGFFYERVNETGDLTRYILSFSNYVSDFSNREGVLDNLYEYFYPVWYSLFYFLKYFNLDIKSLNFISGFVIYFSMLYSLNKLVELNKISSIKIEGQIVLKIFLFFSIFVMFSSYRNLLTFSLFYLGVFLIFINNEKIIGWLCLILSLGIHPISIIPLLAFLFSNLKECNKKTFTVCLFFGLLFSLFKQFASVFLSLPFVGDKINTYILGGWSVYRFQDNGEYLRFFMLILVVCFSLTFVYYFNPKFKNNTDKTFYKYNNFLAWFLSLSMIFISFRTFSMRLFLDGFVFFIPFLYQFLVRKYLMKRNFLYGLFFILWWFMIDFRALNFMNNAYVVGVGFPLNLLSSFFVSIK